METKLSVRCRSGNANHHLWNNHGTYWCHLTVHFPDFTKGRLRLSLETGDVVHARQLRDAIITLLGGDTPRTVVFYPVRAERLVCSDEGKAVSEGGLGSVWTRYWVEEGA